MTTLADAQRNLGDAERLLKKIHDQTAAHIAAGKRGEIKKSEDFAIQQQGVVDFWVGAVQQLKG